MFSVQCRPLVRYVNTLQLSHGCFGASGTVSQQMPRPTEKKCGVCSTQISKYVCPVCSIAYCSVSCFKEHKGKDCAPSSRPVQSQPSNNVASPQLDETKELIEPPNLRPLTTLKWPYIPDDSSYDDPLKRDDPKPLKLKDYEAIATSQEIRQVLASDPNLPTLLRKVDKLRGKEREETLEALLGVSLRHPDISVAPGDADAIKNLAAAIERCVRGVKPDTLGLDWE